jgi:hypothetical protein
MREPLRDKERLNHMLAAIERVIRYTSGKAFDDMKSDDMMYYAVVKNIEIIGEAANLLSPEFIASHPNYVFTEYIHPSKQFNKYSDQIHTLRIVTLNTQGNNPQIIGGYLRLPNKNNGEANYTVLDGTDINKFNLFVELKAQSGEYGNAMKTFCNRVEGVARHPDTNEVIAGTIPNYDSLKQTILGIAQRFNTLEWLGFDIGVTNNGFKCMEINTHPGIKYMQIFRSLYADDITREYFMRKVHEIKALSEEDKLKRNIIAR